MTNTQRTFNVYRLPCGGYLDIKRDIHRSAWPVPGSAVPSNGETMLVAVPEGVAYDGELVGQATNWLEAQALA